MMKAILFFVVFVMFVFSAQCAKRVKVCDVSNGESPNRKIMMGDCKNQVIYYCGTGDAQNKGKWQNCEVYNNPPSGISSQMNLGFGQCDDDDNAKEFWILAYQGNEEDALCIEDVDYDDILTTYCDDLFLLDDVFSSGAGWCESLGWGALREYNRMWLETQSGESRCSHYHLKRGGNGQEVLVYGGLLCGSTF